MPLSWTSLFRVFVLLLMAAHVFYMYAFARMLQEIVGLDPPGMLASSSFALVLLVPLVPAVAIPDLPVIIRDYFGRRRWRQGLCAKCGYSLMRGSSSDCPECGTDRRKEPSTFQFGWPTARRFTMMAVSAWFIGCVAAEGWANLDEAQFAREAEAFVQVGQSQVEQYSRPRRWPMQDKKLYYTHFEGVTAYSPDLDLGQRRTD